MTAALLQDSKNPLKFKFIGKSGNIKGVCTMEPGKVVVVFKENGRIISKQVINVNIKKNN